MKYLRFTYLFIITTLLSSCWYNYPTSTTQQNNQEKEKTTQKIAEESIKEHIKKHFNNEAEYNDYTFGKLFILKPKEIIELDKLYDIRKTLPNMEENYSAKLDSVIIATDTAIAQKIREIRQKNIYHTYEINHLFTIKPSKKF